LHFLSPNDIVTVAKHKLLTMKTMFENTISYNFLDVGLEVEEQKINFIVAMNSIKEIYYLNVFFSVSFTFMDLLPLSAIILKIFLNKLL
ncbi:hypothetical protein L9F63_004684, partial [Diploptera punctata]